MKKGFFFSQVKHVRSAETAQEQTSSWSCQKHVERKKLLSLEAWLMQGWGHARLRHCPVLAEHLNPGQRTAFTAAVGSVYHLSVISICNVFLYTSFFLSLCNVYGNEKSVLTATPWINSPSCQSWNLMAEPSCLHFSSNTNPQIPLCPPASWPPSPEQPCSHSRRILAILSEICFIVPWTPVCHLDGKQSETRAALLLSVKWLMHGGGRGVIK